jgi:hypothetical protein
LRYDLGKNAVSCILDGYKLIINELKGTTELYDISRDFSEAVNLVDDEREVYERLSSVIQQHLKDVSHARASLGVAY